MRKKGELSSKSHNGWTDERGPVNRVSPRLHPGIGRRAPSLSAEEVATINEGFVEQHTVHHIREAGQLAMLEPACEPSSLARPADQLLDWSWKSRLKVQQLGPKRRDLDTSHLLVHRAHLGLKSIPLIGADTLSGCSEVFGRHAIHYIDGGSTSHEQNMRRESVRINGECHFWICFQCRHFGRVRNRAKHKLNTVPVQTNRNRARKSVESEICQPRRNTRLH